jgi:hypothetical protein
MRSADLTALCDLDSKIHKTERENKKRESFRTDDDGKDFGFRPKGKAI